MRILATNIINSTLIDTKTMSKKIPIILKNDWDFLFYSILCVSLYYMMKRYLIIVTTIYLSSCINNKEVKCPSYNNKYVIDPTKTLKEWELKNKNKKIH